MQSFYAKDWPWKLVHASIFMAVVIFAVVASWKVAFIDLKGFFLFVIIVLLSLPLGYFTGTLFTACFFGPLYTARGDVNGSPFAVGDMVQILSGPHKGRVVRIYSKWQGNSVRVELGEQEKETFGDVFSPHKLIREKNAEPSPACDSQPCGFRSHEE